MVSCAADLLSTRREEKLERVRKSLVIERSALGMASPLNFILSEGNSPFSPFDVQAEGMKTESS